MSRTRDRFGRLTAGLGAAAVVSCAVVVGAPHAAATVDELTVNSRNPQAGCVYQLTAKVNHWFEVWFYDNALVIAGSPVKPVNGVATIQWKPGRSGTHTLAALQGLAYEIKVDVAEPTLTGSATCGAGPLGWMGS
ncbi:hypothetical protein IU436_23175 [Nocardia farcinica]|uniref:Secreted protein n=1 Tax=Nocardia farcinica TaxID=37329 RepID=A0A0H5NVZ7_NOCFR|nr:MULTISPECIES: hypothetical protein [Nocardia]AXK86468.1 hypothetical protein DXT66_13270 [Nocardia farcinica]MBF6072182.1 hypothetical protein [Nocardia farcinica]MBF6138656.1 hypothetical protein [Nocardia farcinica]MBF6187414.1 hypothetical protein [Nocardia farcinica]MBF6314727.1 hypothetical protein [Nocardia farcinica]